MKLILTVTYSADEEDCTFEAGDFVLFHPLDASDGSMGELRVMFGLAVLLVARAPPQRRFKFGKEGTCFAATALLEAAYIDFTNHIPNPRSNIVTNSYSYRAADKGAHKGTH